MAEKFTPDELAARFQANPLTVIYEDLMTKVVHIALRHSMQRTPVKRGTLRRSETTRVEAGGKRGFVGTNVIYAPFVHYGTKFMEARPFFDWGIQDSRAEIDQALQKAGDDYFKKIVS